MASPDRAQSETVGVLLLTGVVVVTVGLIGFVVLSGTASERDRTTAVAVDVSTDHVTLTHDGGETLPESEVVVIVDGQRRERYRLTELDRVAADGDGRFEPGESWRVDHGTAGGDAVRVRVVHEPSGSVIRNELTQVPAGSGPIARFDYDPDRPSANETVTFDAGGTIAGTESVDAYEWTFGDGTTATGQTVSRTYASAGEYDVTLTVTAGDERSRTTETVRVAAEPPSLSGVSLTDGADNIVTSGDTLTVSGTVESETESVDTVTADASAFDAGMVTLTDGDDDGTYDATFTVGESPTAGEQSATVTVSNAAGDGESATTGPVTVDTTPPTIASTNLTDGGNDVVNASDSVTMTATVTDDGTGVDTVTADASAFDAGTVTLTDDNDGTYDATVSVGENPTEGDQSVTVTATDIAGNSRQETTDTVRVDTTAPTIETFEVEDTSEFESIIFYFQYVEEFQIQWAVSDATLANTTVEVIRSGTTRDTFSGSSGDEQYQNVRPYRVSGREHTIRVVAVDAAGNRACRQVVDTADGTDPDGSQYESC